MDELFRFMLLRPAVTVPTAEVRVLEPTFSRPEASLATLKEEAESFVRSKHFVSDTGQLRYGALAQAVATSLEDEPKARGALAEAVEARSGKKLEEVVRAQAFDEEESKLADSLVAMKALSGSAGADALSLAQQVRGYDALRRAASADDGETVSLRPLSISLPAEDPSPPEPRPARPPEKPPARSGSEISVAEIEAAIQSLSSLPASSFHVEHPTETERNAVSALSDRVEELERQADKKATPVGRAATPSTTRPWMLRRSAVTELPVAVTQAAERLGLSFEAHDLPTMLMRLDDARQAQMVVESAKDVPIADRVDRVGAIWKVLVPGNEYVGPPSGPMPSGHGSVRPAGVGDLLMVKQHVLRYEGGEVAHIENVLKTERLERDTRRLDRTETTIVQETETTTEEERDQQTTDRFSLKRETTDTIKQDTDAKAGLAVDAKYGPFVEVKANADFSSSTSAESSAHQATEFSKDVVNRSVSKVVERVLERRSTTTISEFEEKYSHGFDNTNGSGHVSGVYQWVDKVMQAQIFNYGKRLLLDVTVPEPGTNFILTQTDANDEGQTLTKPPPFTLKADQIDEGNYRAWAHLYDVTGVEPPPPLIKTFNKPFDAPLNQDPRASTKSDSIAIEDGYAAKYLNLQAGVLMYSGAYWPILVGSNYIDGLGTQGYADMSNETNSVPIAYSARQVEVLSLTVEIFCERTKRAFQAWQLKVHDAITQGCLAKQKQYEEGLAEAQAAAGVVIQGRNPLFNARLVTNELRRQCLTLITGQQFDGFGALDLSSEGYAQPDLTRTAATMPYVRFFEQAFEWEHLVYFFYPYFWGWKPGWKKRMLLDDVDPQFADFLRAGAARVVLPVRPGFEAAITHYLETGEIWNGGQAPEVNNPLYVPIVKEIEEAENAPGNETPVGEPWLVRLPTTLVHLRPDDDLPKWKKVGQDWQPDE